MAVVEVPCPGCGAVLKAPDTMAGKKGRCKKCNTPFRIPGPVPSADSVGESQMLSAFDSPAPTAPAAAAPRPSGDPFDFLAADLSPPPTPEPPKPKSVPKAKALPPEKKPAARPSPTAAASAPAADPAFDFGAMLDEQPAPKTPVPRTSEGEDVPQAESVSEDEVGAAGSEDPFGFPAGTPPAEAGPASSPRGQPKGKVAKGARDARSGTHHHGYRKQAAGGGKSKLILVGVGVLLLGGAIAGLAVYVGKNKGEQAQAGKGDDKDKKGDAPAPAEPTKNDPTPPDPKDAKGGTGKKDAAKKDQGKKDPGTKGGGTTPGGPGTLPDRALAVIPNSTRPINLQMPRAKPEVFVEPNAPPVPIDVEFDKVRRLLAPGRADLDIGVVWEREGVPNTPGNKLVLDVCRPSGTRQYTIEFTGDGKPVPAADLSDDGRYFAHGDGSKVTVWKVEDKSKVVDAWDVYAALPAQQKAGLAAVYFPMTPKEKKDLPPDRLVTVATDGAVHLWDLAAKTQLGGFVPPRGRPNRVVEGRGVALSQTRHFVVVAVGGTVYKMTFESGLDHTQLADLEGDVPVSLGVATYGETTVYAFETGEKKERAVMLINRGGKYKTWRWPEAAGQPVGVGWVSGDLVAVSTARGAAVMFDYNDENFTFLPKYAVLPAEGKGAIHVTTDVCHWYLIPKPNDPKGCMLVQVSPPAGGGLFDEPNKGGGIPQGRLDVRGLAK
jgi:hypothetical protein